MADDFLSKKKDTGPILDLSKAVVNSKEEFRILFDKVPDYKMRPVKVRQEEIKIREKHKDFKFKTGKKDLKALKKEANNYQNPIPPEMAGIKLEDLFPVPIDWRMLTTLRPKLKLDEDYYSKLVEMGKSQMRTAARDKRALIMDSAIRKTKNKAGVVETRAVACIECGEEFCDGKSCMLFNYESFSRVSVAEKTKKPQQSLSAESKPKRKKSKRRSRSKTKSRGKSKSKSPAKSSSRKSKK